MSEIMQLQERKAGGAEWIGSVPESWTLRPFFSVARQSRRSNKGLVERNLLSLSYGRIINKDITANEGLLPESFETYQIVKPYDMVFRLTDLQNDQRSLRTGLVAERGIITSAYLCVTPKGINPRFFAHAVRAADHRKVFYSRGDGLRQTLKYDDLKWLWVPFPPLPEQQKVVDFVDRETAKIDAVIEKQRALVDGLRERRSVVIFNGATGTEARARSELTDWFGQPPRHWEVDKLGRRARVGNGSTPSSSTPAYWEGGTIPWLNSSVVNTGFVMEPSRLVTEVATRECHLPIVRAGAILMAITGQGKTRGMVAELGIDSTINQHLAFINPDPDYWHVPYLVLLLRAAYGELRRISEESGSTKGALTCSGISAFKVPRPPLEEQRAIAVRLDQETAKIDALIAKSERLIELSHERRAALITAAVTGQINITTDTKALEGAA